MEGLRNSLDGVVEFVLYGFHFLRAFVFEKYFPSVHSLCEFSFREDSLTSPLTPIPVVMKSPLEWLRQVFGGFRAPRVVMPVYCIHYVVGNMMVPKVVAPIFA